MTPSSTVRQWLTRQDGLDQLTMNCMQGAGHSIRRGEKVVCQGTGGVSISAVQIAAAAGAHPIVTSSSDAKLECAAKLGAKEMINYRTCPRWDQAVLQKTDGPFDEADQALSYLFSGRHFGKVVVRVKE